MILFLFAGKVVGGLPPLSGNDEYDSNLQGHSSGGIFGEASSSSGGNSANPSSGSTSYGFMPGSTRNSSPRSQAGTNSVIGPLMGNYDPNSSERFSRKVFVGGLPPDIDEGKYWVFNGTFLQCIKKKSSLVYICKYNFTFFDLLIDEITASFRRFGPLVVDWPHKAESKSYFPPKGYAFLLFQVNIISIKEKC